MVSRRSSNRKSGLDGMLVSFNSSPGMRQQFTGQQRDEETDLDYFWARNLVAPAGRFLSVDPKSAGASTSVPQSWNAYAYVGNFPLNSIDPDGRQACYTITLGGNPMLICPPPIVDGDPPPERPSPGPQPGSNTTPIPDPGDLDCSDGHIRETRASECGACWEFPNSFGCDDTMVIPLDPVYPPPPSTFLYCGPLRAIGQGVRAAGPVGVGGRVVVDTDGSVTVGGVVGSAPRAGGTRSRPSGAVTMRPDSDPFTFVLAIPVNLFCQSCRVLGAISQNGTSMREWASPSPEDKG